MNKFAMLLSGAALLALSAPALAQAPAVVIAQNTPAPSVVPVPVPVPTADTAAPASAAEAAPAAPAAAPEAAAAAPAAVTPSSEAILSQPAAEEKPAAETVQETVKTETTTTKDDGVQKTVTETKTEKTTVKEAAPETAETEKPTKKVKKTTSAYKVETETQVTQKDIPHTNVVNLMDFDLDHDGVLTRPEIGTKLFYMFDTDGNMLIDNLEMNRIGLITLIPMEKSTIKMVDKGADGKTVEKTLNTEEFMAESRLIAYDQNRDGLTPLEFIGVPFNRLDANNDKAIDIDEWKDAYASYVKPKFQRQNHYN